MQKEDNIGCFEVKEINLQKGLPGQLNVYTKDLQPVIDPIVDEYILAVKNVLEITPPELSGDIYENGILLTGAGAQLANLDKRLAQAINCKVSVAENCEQCVAIGTGKVFDLAAKGLLESGFRDVTPGISKK